MNATKSPAHIVKRTPLRAYPGWEIAHNETTGFYWANQVQATATGIGPGERSFEDALFFVKNGRPPIGNELAKCDGSHVLQVTPICPSCGLPNAKWEARN